MLYRDCTIFLYFSLQPTIPRPYSSYHEPVYPQQGPPTNWFGPPQTQQPTPYMGQQPMPPGMYYPIWPNKPLVKINKSFSIKLEIFSYSLIFSCVLDAQKNHLIETVLLSTHNKCFGWEIRKLLFNYEHLSRCMLLVSTLGFKHFYAPKGTLGGI